MLKKTLLVLAIVVATTIVAIAQTFSGKWTGHVEVDPKSLASIPEAQRPMVEQVFEKLKKLKIELTLNEDKTWLLNVPPMDENGKAQKIEGTWTQKDDKLTLTQTKEDGKEKKDDSPQTITVEKDGKTLTLVPNNQGDGPKAKVIFLRPEPAKDK